MNEVLLQAYVPSLATLILVGVGILFNNSRIGDLNTNLNKRMDDLNSNLNRRMDDLNKRMDDFRADTNLRFSDLRDQYSRLETVVVGKLTEVEARLDKIETHLHLH